MQVIQYYINEDWSKSGVKGEVMLSDVMCFHNHEES